MRGSPAAPSLSGRIFRSILAFTLTGIVAFSLALAAIFYLSFEHKAADGLLNQAHRAAVLLDSEPASKRPAVLAEQFDGTVRYTLVGADGTVLFDSAAEAADAPQMENHGNRPEVREALASGEGPPAACPPPWAPTPSTPPHRSRTAR